MYAAFKIYIYMLMAFFGRIICNLAKQIVLT